jgi:pyrroloquinoline-quinone synthase
MPMWSTAEFEARLRSVGDQRYHHKHPFNLRMHEGGLSKEEFRGWVANRFYYQANLPVKDAFILTKLPSPADRRRWMERIVAQDGRTGDDGGIELWLRLGEAVGLPREDLLGHRHVVPGTRFAVDAYVNFCRDRPWLDAVASALTELFAPGLMSLRISKIGEHYPWVAPEGLAYFQRRLTQQPAEVGHLLSLVLGGARSPADQERCVRALEFKCDVLWSLLDAVQHAYSPAGPG